MKTELIMCQLLLYCLGLIIGFLTQLLYPFFFLIIGSLIAGILMKYTYTLIDEEQGNNVLQIKIR